MKRLPALIALVAILFSTIAQARDGAELQLALKKLTVVGSVLYIAAHPDDENTAMLAYLANDRGLRTGYLSLTRGDGGQNLIGDEKGPLLGVLRTEELLAARRIDGAEQFFTRAIDFGYSKTPTETLDIWGHDTILSDVVWVIRKFQPDVIITRFPTTGEGGHGHHTASAILAGEAFTAAADPAKFPRQLQYVKVATPRRLFWNRFSWTRLDPNDPSLAKSLRVDLGSYNPLLGRAYTEIAAESRSQHKSQGFGSAERRGTNINYFDQIAGDPARSDLFEGIDTSWARYPGGESVGKLLQQAYDSFDPKNPSKSIPLLLQALDAMNRIPAEPEWKSPRPEWLEVKKADLLAVVRDCAGLAIDVSAADSSVVPGSEIPVSVTVVNRSDYPFKLSAVAGRYANPGKTPGVKLENNVPVKTDISIKIPDYASYTRPYWLRDAPTRGAWTVQEQSLIGLPEDPPAVPINIALDDQQRTIIYSVPMVFRRTDPVRGEVVREVDIVPDVTVNLGAGVYVFPDAKPKSVSLWLQDFDDALQANVRLALPPGWKSDPETLPVTFEKKGSEARATFDVTPPLKEGIADAAGLAELPNGKKMTLGVVSIDYPHIAPQRILSDTTARLVRVDVKKRGSRIGYIMGSGDDVDDALRQIGYEVTLLSDYDLERGDFARFDAIVTGVRAYNTRKILRFVQPKLMKYVENGGTMVVQYNTTDDLVVASPGPYPFKISRDRVTVEEAPVSFDAAHPLLSTPNKITQADFDGWVQERGLYFTTEWDPKYTTVMSSNDPGEPVKAGGELFASYGKGVFIYTSYSWFRQLPAGVPGAYKLFANLVSARGEDSGRM